MKNRWIVFCLIILIFPIQAHGATYTDTSTVYQVQQFLNNAGYDCGSADGILGNNTRSAIISYQVSHGMEPSGDITDELLSYINNGTASSTFSSASSGFSPEELCSMARDYYEDHHNYRPPAFEFRVNRDDSVSIHLYTIEQKGTEYEHTATSDWYNVDPLTGKGTNLLGDPVDLSLYAPSANLRQADSVGDVIYNVTKVLSMKPDEAAISLGFTNRQIVRNIEDPSRTMIVCTPETDAGGTLLSYNASEANIEGAFTIEIADPGYYLCGLKVGAPEEEVKASMLANEYTIEDTHVFEETDYVTFLAPSAASIIVQFRDGECVSWNHTSE